MVLLTGAISLWGQTATSAASPDLAQGRQVFAQRCAGCHGADALGTDRAPRLAGNREVSERSVFRLQQIILHGIPGTGMPAFALPSGDLNAVANLVHSFTWQAASSNVPGDAAAGEHYFFGAGQCATCHMVDGRGTAVGPDLSQEGLSKTVGELRSALLDPATHMTPGYTAVAVTLHSGETIRGFARERSDFELRLQDFKGNFHEISDSEIASVEDQPTTMPTVAADVPELQNLMAYLSRRTGIAPGTIEPTAGSGGISFEDILHPKPGSWPSYNGLLGGNRFSELTQINTDNVDKLQPRWIFTVPLWKQLMPDTAYYQENMKYYGLETTPIVADGVMYVTGARGVFALDARSGRELWEYTRPLTPGLVGDASLGTNKGAAVLGNNVFVETDNAHLLALNRTTGQPVWEQVLPDEPEHYGATVAPLVVDNLVIAGVSGADWGMRGFLSAYDATTGKRVWRLWTVPAAGEPGIETWKGPVPKLGGGATWLTGSYDPETDTLYWTTATPFPSTDGQERLGDNLYTDCVLAVDPHTGKIKWYYQFTPHDVHVFDANEPAVLVDTEYQGEPRKLLLLANRNGFFYVLDRTNGKLLLGKPFITHLTWASGIGPDGRPQLLQEGDVTCPGEDTATNWSATSFSPLTHLFYVMANEKCIARLNGNFRDKPHVGPAQRYLRALNIETGKIVWQDKLEGNAEGKRKAGVLGTAGGLIFYGAPAGDFEAVDESNGKVLWHFTTSGENKASPMTYTAGGRQYVAMAIGANIISFALPDQTP
jgi:PQQ-dependent dehydrogenase (methanol/ethanol family)